MGVISCPVCSKSVQDSAINEHLDSACQSHLAADEPPSSTAKPTAFFSLRSTQAPKVKTEPPSTWSPSDAAKPPNGLKRPFEQQQEHGQDVKDAPPPLEFPEAKRAKYRELLRTAPLAERMRPRTLDEVVGQGLVGKDGVIRGLIEDNRIPSMILWGASGTGKTTIARLIAHTAGSRYVEINSTSSGVNECKKIFAEAQNERMLTGRKTIVFCDEIHRFNKAQQDVFLGPVEAGQVTLIGATTENPSFKVNNALLSRCRTFTLAKLSDDIVVSIMERALKSEFGDSQPPPLLTDEFLAYLAAFSDGDARTSLNLLELAIDLSKRPNTTAETLKKSLTHTLVYDRAGDQHYDSISAFHKSIRGSDPDAALYYLARMLQSGEDPLYIARRLTVIASEDIGLADNSMLPLASATYSACQNIGMPECRINLAHCTVAFAQSKKSTRAYRGLGAAQAALAEPGVAALPIPVHLRNAPTRLMKELGYGKEYKYNPDFVDGRVVQEYLPEKLTGRTFLEDRDLGTKIDPDLPGPDPPDAALRDGCGDRERQPEPEPEPEAVNGREESEEAVGAGDGADEDSDSLPALEGVLEDYSQHDAEFVDEAQEEVTFSEHG